MFEIKTYELIGNNKEMQDRILKGSMSGGDFFGILDGHGSSQVVDYVAGNIFSIFNSQYEKGLDVFSFFESSFHILNKNIIDKRLLGGTTIVLLYIDRYGNHRVCYVGDSLIFGIDDKGFFDLINRKNHSIRNSYLNGEFERMSGLVDENKLKIMISDGYINGINMTRSIGDIDQDKKYGVNLIEYMPQVIKLESPFSRYVIASDGINRFDYNKFQVSLLGLDPFLELRSYEYEKETNEIWLDPQEQPGLDNLAMISVQIK